MIAAKGKKIYINFSPQKECGRGVLVITSRAEPNSAQPMDASRLRFFTSGFSLFVSYLEVHRCTDHQSLVSLYFLSSSTPPSPPLLYFPSFFQHLGDLQNSHESGHLSTHPQQSAVLLHLKQNKTKSENWFEKQRSASRKHPRGGRKKALPILLLRWRSASIWKHPAQLTTTVLKSSAHSFFPFVLTVENRQEL